MQGTMSLKFTTHSNTNMDDVQSFTESALVSVILGFLNGTW